MVHTKTMTAPSYPQLRLVVLNALVGIKDAMEADPEFLNASPYDNETKEILNKLLSVKIVETVVEREVPTRGVNTRGRPSKDVQLSDEDKGKIRDEITALIDALNTMGTGEGLETNERLQVIKAKSRLVNDMLGMRERNTTAQKVESFMDTVISILNDLVDEKDRDAFLKRIDGYR